MTFIYEHDPYFLEIYRMCKYKLPTSRLSKVTVWQTNPIQIIYHAASRVVNRTNYAAAARSVDQLWAGDATDTQHA